MKDDVIKFITLYHHALPAWTIKQILELNDVESVLLDMQPSVLVQIMSDMGLTTDAERLGATVHALWLEFRAQCNRLHEERRIKESTAASSISVYTNEYDKACNQAYYEFWMDREQAKGKYIDDLLAMGPNCVKPIMDKFNSHFECES